MINSVPGPEDAGRTYTLGYIDYTKDNEAGM